MARKRSPMQRECDLELEARLYLAGNSQREIAERVGVTQQQVSLDLEEIRGRWSHAAEGALLEARAQELAKLDHLERTAWEAWDASKASGPGDPRFLQRVLNCIERRVKILGLDAPERHISQVTVARPYIDLSDAELLAMAAGTRKPEN